MSEKNNNNKASKSEYEKKQERIENLTAGILKLGEKYGIGKNYEKKRSNGQIQTEAVGSLSEFVNDIFNLKANDGSSININKDDLDYKSDSFSGLSELDPKLATYVKFALLHKTEQEYIFYKNFGVEPKNFSYEELRDINNASLDHDRHVVFHHHGDISRAINKDFKPSMLFRLRTDYGDLETVEDEKYYSLVVEPKTKKHDIEKVAEIANIALDKNEQKLVSKLMKQMDKDKNIPTGFESACGITEDTKNKLKKASEEFKKAIETFEQEENNLKLGKEGGRISYTDYYENSEALSQRKRNLNSDKGELDKLISHVEYRQRNIEEKDFVRKKITLGTHISMKDLESKFEELNGQQQDIADKDELKPSDFSQDNALKGNSIKNVHKEQEKNMSEPSETLKQKNEILKQRSELKSRMERKLGRTCFFKFGKRKELKSQIRDNDDAMSKIIDSFGPEDIHNLSFYSLTPKTLQKMSKSQIINIPKDQIRKLDQEQIRAIGTKLRDEELGYIQNINFGLDSKQIDDDKIKLRAKFVEPKAMDFIDIEKMESELLYSFTKNQIRALSMKKMANLNENQFRAINYKRKNEIVEKFVYKKQKESQNYEKKLASEKEMFPVKNFDSLKSVFSKKEALDTAMKKNVGCYEDVCDAAQKHEIYLGAKSKNSGAERNIFMNILNAFSSIEETRKRISDSDIKIKFESLNNSQEKVADAKKELNAELGNVHLEGFEKELNKLDLNNSEDRKKLLNPLIKDVLKAKKENTTLLGQGWHKIKNFFRSESEKKRSTRDIINDINEKIKKAEIGTIAKSEVNNRLKDNKEEDKNLDQELEALKRDSKSPEELRDEKQMKDYEELKEYGLTDQDIEDIESGNVKPYEDDYDLEKNSFDVKQKLGFDDAEKENKNTRRRNSIAGTEYDSGLLNKLAAGVKEEQNENAVQQENQVNNKEQKKEEENKVNQNQNKEVKQEDNKNLEQNNLKRDIVEEQKKEAEVKTDNKKEENQKVNRTGLSKTEIKKSETVKIEISKSDKSVNQKDNKTQVKNNQKSQVGENKDKGLKDLKAKLLKFASEIDQNNPKELALYLIKEIKPKKKLEGILNEKAEDKIKKNKNMIAKSYGKYKATEEKFNENQKQFEDTNDKIKTIDKETKNKVKEYISNNEKNKQSLVKKTKTSKNIANSINKNTDRKNKKQQDKTKNEIKKNNSQIE